MKVYEVQRFCFDNEALVAKGMFLERLSHIDKETQKDEYIREYKEYFDHFREIIEKQHGTKMERVITHFHDETMNVILEFPIKATAENIYTLNYDEERGLFYIELKE